MGLRAETAPAACASPRRGRTTLGPFQLAAPPRLILWVGLGRAWTMWLGSTRGMMGLCLQL